MNVLSRVVAMLMLIGTQAMAQFDSKAIKLVPSQPQAGQAVSVIYEATGTKLAAQSAVDGVVYALDMEAPVALTIPLTKDGSVWKGSFTIPAKTKALAFSFSNDGKHRDNNDDKGYTSYLYQNGTILPGSQAALGQWYSGGCYYAGLDPDKEQARILFQQEFKANPSLKRSLTPAYIRLLDSRTTADKALIEKEISTLLMNTDQTAEELSAITNGYETIGKKAESADYRQRLRTKFPDAGDALIQAYRRFNRANDIAAKKVILDSIRTRFANSRELNYFDGYLTGDLASAYVKAGKLEEISKLANNPNRAAAVMRTLNSIAWSNAEKDSNLVQSAQLAKQATDWAKEQIGQPRAATDQTGQTDTELDLGRKLTYAQYADTYGFILMKLGKSVEAVSYLKDAVVYGTYKDAKIDERYALALANMGANDELVTLGKKVIRGGNSTDKLEELFKTAYAKTAGGPNYEAMLASLKKEASVQLKADLMDKMINKPAPGFSLVDLNGQPVTLASLKGKVVVIDFWATWCGPCVASFPGMQKAVTKYAQMPDVAFLFVNTWQQEADKQKNASDFINKKKYTFQVLIDDKDEVVTNYKISGIPTKVIIDKNGALRFKSVGYNGDADKTATEISQMIDILQDNTMSPTVIKSGE